VEVDTTSLNPPNWSAAPFTGHGGGGGTTEGDQLERLCRAAGRHALLAEFFADTNRHEDVPRWRVIQSERIRMLENGQWPRPGGFSLIPTRRGLSLFLFA